MFEIRRCFLVFALALLVTGAAHAVIEVQLLAGGLDEPVGVENAGDGSGRLFIVSQRGSIYIWDGTQVLNTPFLDIETRVTFGGERGLLGLAFHPNYAANGRFFVHYSDITGGDTVMSEFAVTADPNVADPDSETILYTADQPFTNHNGGGLAFDLDGFLYLALGDGGSAFDPGNRAQTLSSQLGKIHRFDIDIPAPYIPASNPFVGVPGALDEIWAYGLRNPWRITFDRETGDLFIGDVGQNQTEEIDFELAGNPGGENYGWRLMEGSQCFDPGCNDGSLILPVMEYQHSDGGFQGCSVSGGYRYRGVSYAELTGLYFYADFCTGKIWSGRERIDGTWVSTELLDTSIAVTSFGEDENGEIYLVGNGGLFALAGTGAAVLCNIDTDQEIYNAGDTLIATVAEMANVGTSPQPVRLQLGIILPTGTPIIVLDVGADGSFVVDAGVTLDGAPFEIGTIPGTTPAGNYFLGCRLSDPVSGDAYAQSGAPFEVQ